MAGGAFKTGAVGAGVAAASMNVARPPPIQAAIMGKGSPREAAPTWLIGEKVRLRPIEPADVGLLQRWINSSPARDYILTRLPLSLEQERDWAANASVNPNMPVFVIQTLGLIDIGTAALHIEGSRATLGIAIHEPEYWNRGYGTDAVKTLVDGAFRARQLVRIDLTALPENSRAIRCYERAGFAREGVLRRYIYQDGAYRDVVIMSVLHEEWAARRSHKRPSKPRSRR